MRIPRIVARSRLDDHLAPVAYVLRWTGLVAPAAVAIGSAVALFLWALERATSFREGHGWLLWLLPAAGLAIGYVYHRYGGALDRGNNLIVDEIHEPGGGVPTRLAPLVVVATVVTHLFGGSAGREGTAVQVGGAFASSFTRLFRLDPEDTSILLTTGMAAGFGAVFGTPLTGAIFALEVLALGRITYRALIPCLIASIIGDATVGAWGVHHVTYAVAPLAHAAFGHVDLALLGKVVVAAATFGLVSMVFAEATHAVSHFARRTIGWAPLRPVAGALIVIALTYALGTRDYLGLGVTSADPHAVTLVSSFTPGGAHAASWFWKLVFTAVTLGSGFKGGEVTPLFFIGAALGNSLGTVLHAPVDLFAALGFVAVFSGATNTPLACTLMGVELFGADAALYVATASFVAYLFSGHSGIYAAQRIGTPKGDVAAPREPGLSLAALRERRRAAGATRTRRSSVAALATPEPAGPLADLPFLHIISVHAMSHTPSITEAAAHADHGLRAPLHVRAFPIQSHPMGQVRVYLKPSDRAPAAGVFGKIFGRSAAHALVMTAKQFGLPHALVLHTRYGYTGGGPIGADHPEYGIDQLPICVELMGESQQLEAFCRDHAALLLGRLVVFRHAEQWELVSAPPTAAAADEVAIA